MDSMVCLGINPWPLSNRIKNDKREADLSIEFTADNL